MLLASANRRNPWILPSNLCRRLLTVSPQGIRFFSVRSIITNVEVLFVHSKINYAVDQNTNQAPDNGVPPDDEKCSAGLVPHLLEANFCFPFKDAVHYARTVGLVGVHHSKKVGSAKEAREESPQEAGYCVRVEDPQRVVDALEEGRSSVQHHHRVPRY
ncbi:hypothetical protein ACFX13_018550 [Malus domestica]